jgi:hypothetical protein
VVLRRADYYILFLLMYDEPRYPARSWDCSLNFFQEAVVTGIKWEYTREKKGRNRCCII